jgi:hypothetical protein
MNASKTSPQVIDKRERATKALELRKAGISYDVIAQRLNYSNRTAAYRAVSRLLESTEKEAADDLREVELRRLDDLFLSIYQQARNGNLGAVDRCLRIMERRAKIAGIDAPEKTQQDVRQIIKVVYEDVQYAEDFNDDPQVVNPALLATNSENLLEFGEEEEMEGDVGEWGVDIDDSDESSEETIDISSHGK